MKFEFTEEHEALRELIADVVAQEADSRSCYDDDTFIDNRLWTTLCGAGVVGVAISEAYEGGNAGPVEQTVIAEELGRAVGGVPFAEHAAAGEAVQLMGSDDQRKRLLIPIARGEVVAGIVLPEPANLRAITATATGCTGGWTATYRWCPTLPQRASLWCRRR